MAFAIDKKFIISLGITGSLGAMIIYTAYILFYSDFTLFSTTSMMAGFLITLPIIIKIYSSYRMRKSLEETFPVFLRDFVESMRGGMTLPQAFKSVSVNDYGALTKYVKKISAQLEWGIPVDKVLLNFSKETKSKVIGRVVSSVIESHRYGGNLADTFEALSKTAVEVDRLRAERRLFLQSQMITGYIIFFVFLAVIIGLERFLVPSLSAEERSAIGNIGQKDVATQYESIFRNLILIQGLFAGLSVGKMSEGSIVAGVKHSFIMMFVGLLVFLLGGQIPEPEL